MAFVLIIAWIVAFYLIITDHKTDYVRYFALMLFVGGLGALGRIVITIALPFLRANHLADSSLQWFISDVYLLLSFIGETGLPYTFLMFSVCYSGFFNGKTIRILGFVLTLSPLAMLYPLFSMRVFDWGLMYAWVAPYYLAAFSLLVATWIKEASPLIRRRKLFILLLSFPQAYMFLAHYTLTVFHIMYAYRFMAVAVPVWFVFVVACAVKHDFLGLRLKVERMTLHQTMRVVSTGTAILNHSLKNEVGRISLTTDRIRSKMKNPDTPCVLADLDVIQKSARHLLQIVDRIHYQMQEIALEKRPEELIDVIEAALFTMKPYIETYNMKVDVVKKSDLWILCDQVHLQEVFSNLFMNACEAAGPSGHLEVLLYGSSTGAVVSIIDNGVGINKENLPHLYEPFFSTKMNPNNFGLGLSYCHNVIQQHGASIEIKSELGVGTTVYLYFPKKLVVKYAPFGSPSQMVSS